MSSSSWFVYILLCDDDTLYTGITTDLEKRLSTHQAGTGARYTRSRGVKKIVYSEKCRDRSEASIREAEFKKLSRTEKLELIEE